MRFIIMHATNPRWEAGDIPSQELIRRVGALLGEMSKAGVFEAGEGLGATSRGARLRFSGGTRTVTRGPFPGVDELPAGFSVVRARSLEEAIEWATRAADALGPEAVAEIDVRPVIEPWDIGMRPKPADLSTHRYMVLQKATATTEHGAVAPDRRAALSRLIDETTNTGVHLVTHAMRPSRRGRRYINARNGVSAFDGPFAETKELLAGFVIVSAASLEDAGRWAARYLDVVDSDQVDVRELE
jgi:hypothetical protein